MIDIITLTLTGTLAFPSTQLRPTNDTGLKDIKLGSNWNNSNNFASQAQTFLSKVDLTISGPFAATVKLGLDLDNCELRLSLLQV